MGSSNERGSLDYSRFSSSVAEELAAQETEFAALKKALAEARSEGERLRATKVEAPQITTIEQDDTAPSMAELFALSNKVQANFGKLECKACNSDLYTLRTQLITCTSCSEVYHAGCVGLRPIPFKGSSSAEVRNRELFIKRYFGDWRCSDCRKQGTHDKEEDMDQPHPIISPTRRKRQTATICATCNQDPPADRAQLLTCFKCDTLHHTTCLNLKKIPFSTRPADRAHRERFIRVHFDEWVCPLCSSNPSQPQEKDNQVRIDTVLNVLHPLLAERDAHWRSCLDNQTRPSSYNDHAKIPVDVSIFLKDIEEALLRVA